MRCGHINLSQVISKVPIWERHGWQGGNTTLRGTSYHQGVSGVCLGWEIDLYLCLQREAFNPCGIAAVMVPRTASEAQNYMGMYFECEMPA